MEVLEIVATQNSSLKLNIVVLRCLEAIELLFKKVAFGRLWNPTQDGSDKLKLTPTLENIYLILEKR